MTLWPIAGVRSVHADDPESQVTGSRTWPHLRAAHDHAQLRQHPQAMSPQRPKELQKGHVQLAVAGDSNRRGVAP
jgi:hypothetical protein